MIMLVLNFIGLIFSKNRFAVNRPFIATTWFAYLVMAAFCFGMAHLTWIMLGFSAVFFISSYNHYKDFQRWIDWKESLRAETDGE